ncbi:MAG TPA: hypothetical protein DCR40_12205 [Prolixibacteraceae bacterium]|nr:hypothetical protein [Prolixibacteraceae bacterium]
MKLIRLITISGIVLFFAACRNHQSSFPIINSQSFNEIQVTLDGSLAKRIWADSMNQVQEQIPLSKKLDEMIAITQTLQKTKPDSSWMFLMKSWEELRSNEAFFSSDTLANPVFVLQKWAELNISLLKLTGEVRFGDTLEKLLYGSPAPVLSERLLKSVIYTHIFDQIFINLIGSSSLNHYHTTGGMIKLTQETDFPVRNEMYLKCESNDVRYLDVFVRIPEWAVNPTVSHGNVKYVAHPGEYCQISRKWRNGDEFKIILKN